MLTVFDGLDCTSWTDQDRDQAMPTIAWAHERLERAQFLFEVADWLRERAFEEGE